uniref:TSA: Wollemia nobilis Ref_Wollemi_Transcript_11735_3005 transcribed RNA sequence n=1 Tax=Wollemia nobilis TaxID=56998 RepID=A0A0C9QSI8_9CONI
MATAPVCTVGLTSFSRSAFGWRNAEVPLPNFFHMNVALENKICYLELRNDCCGRRWSEKQHISSFKFATQASQKASNTVITSADQSPPSKEEQDCLVRVVNITKDTLGLRSCSYERLKFEVEYGLKRGTTDNSYIIKGPMGVALIDIPDQAFTKEYIRNLKNTKDINLLKYIVIGHLSPKRINSMIALGELLQQKSTFALPLDVYCSNPAAQLLSVSIPEKLKDIFSIKIVRSGDKLDLGGDHMLQFILTPTPRWPDGMCTYDPATQLIFTHKFFSAHVCTDNDFDVGGWEAYGEDWRFFYDCMLSPVARQVDAILQKLPIVPQFAKPSYAGRIGIDVVKADVKYILSTMLSSLNLPLSTSAAISGSLKAEGIFVTAAICPIHGPIVQYTLTELVREYNAWTKQRLNKTDEATIGVIYASAYGNTTALAQAISRGISKAGIGVETLNCEHSTNEEISSLVRRCNGFVIGSPTLAGHMPTPIQNALGVILNDNELRTKLCGVFGSFGWSGEAVDEIERRLKDGGFSFSFPTIRCKFKPTEAMLQICEESGTDIALAVRKSKLKQRRDTSQFVMASCVEQAVGRVVGSLCVVSARNGDAESAMLASWVSQATFVPPGITLAVAKDRAVESLILPGGKFVLNVLGEGKSSATMKQLLKPYKPGEPRFGGLQTKEASNGGRVLLDAISWMECTVQSRMETGDHWVLYATVDDGQLQDDKTLTAIHYRKTGTYY